MNYDNMTKEELINYINSLNEELNGKYGLIWDKEKEPEQIVVDCDKFIPILSEIKEKNIANDGVDNLLIEGDNFHTLSVLNYTHKESVDMIYIDPPYNTGNQDFIYNDKFVNIDDGYKNSKWLNFMSKRLYLARNILKEDGIIAISIDDHELAQLIMLCNKIFGESNFISCMPRKTTEHMRVNALYELQNLNDYVLLYGKNKALVDLNKNVTGEKEFSNSDEKGMYLLKPFQNSGANGTRKARPNLYYPIYYDEKSKEFSLEKKPGMVEILPKKVKFEDGRWLWSREKFEKDKNMLEYRNGTMYRKEYYDENADNNKYESYKTWLDSFPNRLGASSLKELGLDGAFEYSKPPQLIEFLVNLCRKKDSVILDFFAGSGTTGQAVLSLNKKDNGKRRFILCTNNENNICENVTYKRLKNAICGHENFEPLKGNLKYYKTDFVDNNGTRDQLYYDLTEKCIPMLCVKSGTYELIEKTKEYAIYSNENRTEYSCVYFDIFGESYDKFIEKVKGINEHKNLYIFSLSEYVNEENFDGITNYSIEAIPYKILDLYKNVVKMSKEN